MKEALDQDFSMTFKTDAELKGFGETAIYSLDKIIRGNIESF